MSRTTETRHIEWHGMKFFLLQIHEPLALKKRCYSY